MRPDVRTLVALADRGRNLVNLATGVPRRRPRAARLLPVRAATTGRTVVRLYGAIGQSYWDDEAVSAADLARTLDTIGPNGIDLHINSGGGDVFDGIAMHAMLLDHPSDVVAVIDGIAASAASFIALAGDTVQMQKPAKAMVHNAAGLAWGNKEVMREMVNVLTEIDLSLATMYADKTGGTVAEWSAYMDEETWFSSARALEVGLVNEVLNDRAPAAPAEEEPGEDEEEAPPEEDSAVEDRRSIMIRAHHAGLHLARKG